MSETRKKNKRNKEHKEERINTESPVESADKSCSSDDDQQLLNKTENIETKKTWEEFLTKRPYKDEFDAFAKYYEKIKEDNSVLEMVHAADLLALSSYCDLYEGIKPVQKADIYNLDHRPLKKGSEEVLYASPFLRLKENTGKGRHLVAHCPIDKNEIIINEKATVLQVNPLCSCVGDENKLYRCHDCAKVCSIFYTCNNCNVVIFCSLECTKRAYKTYHKFECEGLQRHYWSFNETDYSYIALRMMLYGATFNFNTTPENANCYGDVKNNYPYVYRLKTNFDKLPLEKINQILESCTKTLVYLMCRTNFFKQFDFKNDQICSEMYQYIGGLLVRHYCQAQTNNVLLKFPNVTRGFGFNIISGKGKAICPTIAMINHSCTPNAVVIPYNNYLVVKSIRSIKADEEITICYNEVPVFLTFDDRQIITEELFFFTCKCSLCEFERTWQEHPYKCLLCMNGKAKKVTIDGQELGFCIVCKKNFTINLQVERLAKICGKLYRATYDLNHVLRIAECYSTLYPSNSWMLLDVYRLLYEKYVLWGEKPIETIKYGILFFNILEHYIPRLYLPLLEAKIRFYTEILTNDRFRELERVSDCENDTLKIFHAELLKTKKDLLFYVPVQYIDFYYMGILAKLEQIQSNVLVFSEHQEPKCL